MHRVRPREVLERIARAIPEDCRQNIVIIGSLAAAYQLFGNDDRMLVRTKDVDCLLSPRLEAIRVGKEVVESLHAANWRPRDSDRWSKPGDAATQVDQLPAVRLTPPAEQEWFLELLAPPDPASREKKQWTRLETSRGHFGLPSFRFLGLVELRPVTTRFGIAVARLEMLALANLLEHTTIGPELMSGEIGDRGIKRSNKDLGRVLAIARAGGDAMVQRWSPLWVEALREKFPDDWRLLALQAGGGIRQIVREEFEPDLEEARHTCEHGLLVSKPPTLVELRATGHRLINDAIEPLEDAA